MHDFLHFQLALLLLILHADKAIETFRSSPEEVIARLLIDTNERACTFVQFPSDAPLLCRPYAPAPCWTHPKTEMCVEGRRPTGRAFVGSVCHCRASKLLLIRLESLIEFGALGEQSLRSFGRRLHAVKHGV